MVRSQQEPDLQSEVEQLRAQILVNRSDIDGLIDSSVESSARADSIEGRAAEDRQRIDGLEDRTGLDHKLILELQSASIRLGRADRAAAGRAPDLTPGSERPSAS